MDDSGLTAARLAVALGARPLRFENRTTSTNDLARTWAAEGAAHGAVVVAEEQTAGRGRFGRQWLAQPGSALLFSVILRPPTELKNVARLTMAAAVAIAEVLEELRPLRAERVSLKWPNDVLVGERKVAGILSEGLWEGDQLEAAVVGIGLNVRMRFAGTGLAHRATSIEGAFGVSVDRVRLLGRLLVHLDAWAVRVANASLFEAWRSRLSTLGQRVEVTGMAASGTEHAAGHGGESRAIAGLAADVDADGALLLRDDSGALHRVMAGDVTVTTDSAA